MGDIRKAEEFDALAAKADHAELGLQAQENACALLGIWAVRNRAVISKALRDPGITAAAKACDEYAAALKRDADAMRTDPDNSITVENRAAIVKELLARASAVRIAEHKIRSLPTKDPEQ